MKDFFTVRLVGKREVFVKAKTIFTTLKRGQKIIVKPAKRLLKKLI
jgi:hypothetical protein